MKPASRLKKYGAHLLVVMTAFGLIAVMLNWYRPYMRRINQPNDFMIGSSMSLEKANMSDFVFWAFSDICDDFIKGIFAEWLVSKILRINTLRRYSWSDFDLCSDLGTRIEVKSSSYWQSWKVLNVDGTEKDLSLFPCQSDSKIRFSGLMARDVLGGQSINSVELKSEVYIFCFQHEKNYNNWNAMDLSQWEFYLVPAKKISSKSVSLKWLKNNNFGPLNDFELLEQFEIYEMENKHNNSFKATR